MVRTTIAFAVVALGAAAVIAQAPDASDLEVRGLDDMVEMEARHPEFFDNLEAREYEAEQVAAREFNDEELEARDASGSQNPLPLPVNGGAYPSYPSYNNYPVAAVAPTPVAGDHAAYPASTPTSTPMSGNESPSKTVVTVTQTPTPTPCTLRQVKRQKELKKIKQAVAIVRAAHGKHDLTKKDKHLVKKAKKYLHHVRARRVKAAKRTIKKCKSALKKAGLTLKDCKAGADCESAYLAQDLTLPHCKAAFKYMKRVKAAKKAEKKSKHHKGGKKGEKKGEHHSSEKKDEHHSSEKTDSKKTDDSHSHKKSKKSKSKSKKVKPYSDLLPPTKTVKVGADGVTTVIVKAGPTCTATPGSSTSGSGSKTSRRIIARELADAEFGAVFAREYDFDNLD